MDSLWSNYTPSEILGIGANGVVVKFIPNPDTPNLIPIAVKISSDLDECALSLKFKHIFEDPESKDLFAKIYSCFESNDLSQFDKESIIQAMDSEETRQKANLILNLVHDATKRKYVTNPQKPLVFILSEFLDGQSLHYTKIETREDMYSILFEVKYAIRWAFEKYNFTHNDLHSNNVMIVKNKTPRYYEINGKMYMITSLYQPKMIDYDMASVDLKEYQDYNNYERLVNSILHYQEEGEGLIMFSKEELMDESAIMSQFEITKKIKTNDAKCIFCPEKSQHMLERNYAYKFCSYMCAMKIPLKLHLLLYFFQNLFCRLVHLIQSMTC